MKPTKPSPTAPARSTGRQAALPDPPGRPSRKRAPGRRPSADAADPRAQLLDAALACFTEKGIAATSLRDIARRAGVTPALVHYYFGDKPQLQQAVVAERLLPVISQIHAHVGETAGAPVELMEAFVKGIVQVVAAHPWLPTLWVREILCEGGALRVLMIEHIGPMLPRAMAERFANAQQAGMLNPQLDPRLLVVSMVGLTMFPLASAPIWRQLFGAEELDGAVLQRHTLALLQHGMGLEA